MTREQLFITKTPTHYRDLNPALWFRSLDLRPLDQPAVKFISNFIGIFFHYYQADSTYYCTPQTGVSFTYKVNFILDIGIHCDI
jgi:hypothetical protein